MNNKKKAIITGVTGQDGSYLLDLLLSQNYKVVGVSRRSSTDNTERIKHHLDDPDFEMVEGDITDSSSMTGILKEHNDAAEFYNLAAQSHVGTSFKQPGATFDITGKGCINILQAIVDLDLQDQIKFYQASSSEMFGKNYDEEYLPYEALSDQERKQCSELVIKYQDEDTYFMPQSPYAVAKCAAHYSTRLYREAYGLHASCGILFNHESPRRGENFVTRKITKWLGEFKRWLDVVNHNRNPMVQGLPTSDYIYGPNNSRFPKLRLGNLEAVRDWGHAKDYCIDYDVPILTPNGWKFRNELKVGDRVINFNSKTSALEHDTITDIIDTQSNGDRYRFKGRGVDFKCSENHRIYYQQKSKNSKGGWSDWKVTTAKNFYDKFSTLELRSKYDYRFPGFFKNSIKDYNISDDVIYLLGILLSEGCLCQKNRTNTVSISQSLLANESICKKIEETINNLDLSFNLRKRNDGVVEWVFNSESSNKILSWFEKANVHIMPRYVYSFSQRQAQILFDAMMDGDGCYGNMSYSSKRYLLLMDFQSVANLAGYKTGMVGKNGDCYTLNIISKNRKYNYVQEIELTSNNDKEVWCISTNNKTIITRDNESVFVSGNCEAMWLMLQQDKPDDYVICTGQSHSVKDFLDIAFSFLAIDDWSSYVVIDPKFYRPAEVDYLQGRNDKAKLKLNWKPKTSFQQLVQEMVMSDSCDTKFKYPLRGAIAE